MSQKEKAQEKENKKERHSPLRVIRNVWSMVRYTFKYTPSYIWVTLVEAVGRAGDHIIGVLFLQYLFDSIERGVDFKEVLTYTLLAAAYKAVFELFNKWRLEVYRQKVLIIIHEGMQNELYKKARELDQSCYDDPNFYNDFIWAIRESDKRVVQIMDNISLFINRVISSAVIFVLILTMDWIIAIILIVSVSLSFVVNMILNKLAYKKSLEMNPIDRKLSYISREFYLRDHAKELRRGKIAEHLRRQYTETTEKKVDCVRKYNGRFFWLWLADSLLTNVLPHIGVTGYLIVRYLLDSGLSLGGFSASITATFKMYWFLYDISQYLTKFNEHSLYVEKFRRFLEYEPQIHGEETCDVEFESLNIKNVSFAYPFSKEGERVLKNIDIEINKGEKIAFVGYNGAGKTTLIKLLMRLYDPSEGEILYNQKDIRDYTPESYRKHIAAVFQDYRVFAATVAENVLGRPFEDGDEERVMMALKAASFEDKLATLPNGIHSQLTREFVKDGVGLSGGETQKIAIARAFAHPYELIIMDEPSSALDPIAEYELNRSILEHAEGKTVIFISHRLSTTRMADKIYMFDGGEIVESGDHDALMRLNGKYAQMYRIQAKKYRIET